MFTAPWFVVRLGNAGLQIESSMIWIASLPNFGPKLFRQLLSWSNFDLFKIKINHFRSIFNWKINKSWLKDHKIWLRDQNRQLKDWKVDLNCWLNLITFDWFLISFNINWLFRYSPDIIKSILLRRMIWIPRIWIEITIKIQ